MKQLDKIIQSFRAMESSDLIAQSLQFALWAVAILVISWLIIKGINRAVSDNSMRYRSRKVIRLVSYALIFMLAVISFTGKVQYFTLTIGLISAGLAFALQEIVLSIAGWINIFSSGMYKPGDRIEINHVKGDVIDISITQTTLMEIGGWISGDNYSGRIVHISNAYIFRGPVSNYSSSFPFVWDEINLPIRYGSDIQLASRIILETAQEHLAEYARTSKEEWKVMVKKYLIEDAMLEPSIALKATDNWIGINLRYVVDYKKRRMTRHILSTDLLDRIEKTNGKVALASATFEITKVPDIKVDLRSDGK